MNESIYKEIAAYCHWAGISVKDYFIEQSCKFIFDNDSEWKMYKEQQKAEGKDIV
ncbi:hypothetical protein [Legionella jordanis]|nr:hypothetical protein [Legionella jordanis]